MDNEDRYRSAADSAANDTDAKPASYPPIPPISELRMSLEDLRSAPLTPDCIVDAYLYADVGVMPGPGGAGKTTLFLYESVHVVLGRPLYGLAVRKPGTVVIVTAEDQKHILQARLLRVMDAMGLNEQDQRKAAAGILIWDVTGETCRLAELDRAGNVALTGLSDAIVERFREVSPVLVCIDPAISFGAGERLTNDNENALIQAGRHIVRGLRCCVRLIAHTGKETARALVLDQYASRGGSALPDGCRMVAVLQPADVDKLAPPVGFSLSAGESGLILARPKISYAPKAPNIWIKRRGYHFDYFVDVPADPEIEEQARIDQLERYLVEKFKAGYRFSKNDLEAKSGDLKMTIRALRSDLATLRATGRVVDVEYEPKPARGARGYIHPLGAGSPDPTSPHVAPSEKSAKSGPSPRQEETPLFGSTPYRGKNVVEPNDDILSPSAPRLDIEPCRTDVEPVEPSEGNGVDGDGSGGVDTRHLLPAAALAELPPDEERRPRIKVTIVGKNGLCVSLLTQAAWTLSQWKKFAWSHYDEHASVFGQPAPRGEDVDTEGEVL